jgi:hypothetical protein
MCHWNFERKTLTTQLKTKGSSLDTRLRHSILLDANLQRRLTADEFRAWINLNVWVVSLISDGAFRPDDAEMIANLDLEHVMRFHQLGLVERDDVGNYRVHSDYWVWQSSIADLQKLEQQREANRQRQERHRANSDQ